VNREERFPFTKIISSSRYHSKSVPTVTISSIPSIPPLPKMEGLPTRNFNDNPSPTNAPQASLDVKKLEIDNAEADLLKVT
jgi:hypothetical protein